MSPILVAIVASAIVVLFGPWVGQIRGVVQTAFPGSYGLIVNVAIVLAALTVVGAAVARIRDRRPFRYAMLALSIVTALVAAAGTASVSAAQNAVERFHFIEYGVLTWLYYRAALASHARHTHAAPADPSIFVIPALCTLIVGAVDEWFQWFVPERIGEWRDIFLNATAIGAGLLFSLGVSPPPAFTRRWARRSQRATAFAAALAVVAIAAFIHVVHLGTVVRDDEIGTFRSRYTAAELRATARERSARWARQPPPLTVRRISREDQYLAEAAWHVQARNAAWQRDPAGAWLENRILEEYFAPALDTPSYVMGVSRWPPDQRRDAWRRLGGEVPPPFESRAARLQLFAVSPAVIWLGAIAAVAALGAPLRRQGRHAPPRLPESPTL